MVGVAALETKLALAGVAFEVGDFGFVFDWPKRPRTAIRADVFATFVKTGWEITTCDRDTSLQTTTAEDGDDKNLDAGGAQ